MADNPEEHEERPFVEHLLERSQPLSRRGWLLAAVVVAVLIGVGLWGLWKSQWGTLEPWLGMSDPMVHPVPTLPVVPLGPFYDPPPVGPEERNCFSYLPNCVPLKGGPPCPGLYLVCPTPMRQ